MGDGNCLYHIIPERENADLEWERMMYTIHGAPTLGYVHQPDPRYNFIFSNPNVHSIMYNGTQYWLAKDIARELGYDTVQHMIRNTTPEDIIELSARDVPPESGGTSFEAMGLSKKTPKAAFITERGIYDCLDHSRISPKAEEFRAWSNTMVRPSIRKTGAYLDNDVTEKLIQNPDYVHSIIAQNNELQNQNKKLTTQISENKNYVNVGKTVASGNANITINQLAKILQNQLPFAFGAHALLEHLRFDGFLMRQSLNYNMPTQKSLNMGLMRMAYFEENDAFYPVITPFGIEYFVNHFIRKFAAQDV